MSSAANWEMTDGIADWVICLRGSYKIAIESQSALERFPINRVVAQMAMLRHTSLPAKVEKLEFLPGERESIVKISNLISTMLSFASIDIAEETRTYQQALKLLRETLSYPIETYTADIRQVMNTVWPGQVSDPFVRLMSVTIWLILIPEKFVQLLSSQRPPAMIIMAHFCLHLRRVNDYWYLENRGHKIFQAIQRSLGEQWSAYIEYPRLVFGL